MKGFNQITVGLAVALSFALMVVSPAVSSDTKTEKAATGTEAAESAQNETKQYTEQSSAGKYEFSNKGMSIRVSKLIGMDIQNEKDESVGEIKDIVLDTDTGKVRYAAVTYGGFLGVGDKMFAVPFEAFEYKQDPRSNEVDKLLLNVTKEQLAGDEGFDEENWPDFADKSFTMELDKRYGIERMSDDNGGKETESTKN